VITQELKLYQEPEPPKPPVVIVTYPTKTTTPPSNPANNYNFYGTKRFSQWELNTEQARAFNNGIRMYNKYLNSQGHEVEVIAWNMLASHDIEVIDGKPAIITGRRKNFMGGKDFEFQYSVDEILQMEAVHV
jgi:hypothetical protein